MLRILPLVAAIALGGCSALDSVFGAAETAPLPGERVSILQQGNAVEPSEGVQGVVIRLPRPQRVAEWPQAGGYPDRAMHHLELSDEPRLVWSVSAGSGSSSTTFLTAAPIVANGRVYTMDAYGQVSAFEAATGRSLWRVDVTPADESSAVVAGGIAAAGGRVFVGSGYAEVLALDATTGQVIWRVSATAPVRAAPAVFGDRLYVITAENQTLALSASTGERIWSHQGIQETAGLLGGSSPATDGSVVIAPYSSGEVVALRADTGRVLWGDNLAAVRRQNAVAALSDIRGLPVIDRGLVYAVSHSGRTAAIDVRSGVRLWDRELGGQETVWVAGDWLFLVTAEAEVVALSRRDGQVRWVTRLPRWNDPDRRRGPITWTGPVLASDRLVLAGSNGEAVSLSPYTGEVTGVLRLPGATRVPPVVADGTLYILTDSATLVALR
ncbi:MAG: PQQ-binding-like beta-propeller repeat protein [Alphaproteobacteria bacterium]|nr:PQQ-binding-like beta-propeller repeat protein [Alphaproteobacteria bacterium]